MKLMESGNSKSKYLLISIVVIVLLLLLALLGYLYLNDNKTDVNDHNASDNQNASGDNWLEGPGIYGVELVDYKEINDFDNFYYPDLTCSNDTVYLSFQSNSRDQNINYGMIFDEALHQKGEIVDLTTPFNSEYESETYPDHVLLYHNGFLYGAYQSNWGIGNGDLILAKYDQDLSLIDKVIVVSCGPEQRNYNEGLFDTPVCQNEMFDSPLLSFSEDKIYLTSAYHDDTSVDNEREGTYVRVFDLDLNKQEEFILPVGNNPFLSHGDITENESSYQLVVNTYNEKEDLEIITYDKEYNIISEKKLLPAQYDVLGKDGHSRVLKKDDELYVGFIGGLGPLKTKEGDNPVVPNYYMSIFDQEFNFKRMLRLTGYDLPDIEDDFPLVQKYACIMDDYIYIAVGYHPDDGDRFDSLGHGFPKMFIARYRILGESELNVDVRGPE